MTFDSSFGPWDRTMDNDTNTDRNYAADLKEGVPTEQKQNEGTQVYWSAATTQEQYCLS